MRKIAMKKLLNIFLLLSLLAVQGNCQGPVYVDPAAAKSSPVVTPEQNQVERATQTVYGFADFTTTIGNTVMVFSPQSAAPQEPPKPATTVTSIIETQPQVVEKSTEIKPSKPTETKPEKKETKIEIIAETIKPKKETIQSVVNVVSASIVNPSPPIYASKVEVIAGPSIVTSENKKIYSKVEVVSGPSKIVEVQAQPKKPVYSKVEVKEGAKEIITKVEVRSGPSIVVQSPPQILSSRVEIVQSEPSSIPTEPIDILASEDNENEEDEEPPILVTNNNIGEPEYDFLSRQPSEVVEETYKVINLRPSKTHKPKSKPKANAPASIQNDDDHPIGLVTKLGGTVVKDGATTVHETSVIGTIVNGKYAQVLHSTSHIFQGKQKQINPSPTLRILKTMAPTAKNYRQNLEPTLATSLHDDTSLPLENLFGSSPNLIRPSRRPAIPGGNFKNRYRNNEQTIEEDDDNISSQRTYSSNKKSNKNRVNQNAQQRTYSNRYGKSSSPKAQLATFSVFSEPATTTAFNRRQKANRSFKTSTVSPNNEAFTRRGYKPKVQASTVDPYNPSTSTSLYKFKLNRAPGRWQYKTTPKPRVTIRKIFGDDEPTTPLSASTLDDNNVDSVSRSDSLDLELSGSHNGPGSLLDGDSNDNSIEKPPPVETIKVEISTPADFRDVYYEIATIKSPYTFQVGTVKNTRYITVTSTFEKSFEATEVPVISSSATEPLTENILATNSNFDKDNNLLDSSIATLPPIALAGDAETPPLETLTETFSTTQTMLKTHILPVIYNGGNTTSYTLIQTYHVTRLVTATKTLPPMEVYQFVPSKTLNEFNSRLDEAGSELHLELEFGDDNEENDEENLRRAFPPELNLANVGADFDLAEVDKSRFGEGSLRHKKAHSLSQPKVQQVTEPPPPTTPALTPEQAQQLALLRLLNPAAAAQIPNVITTSKPVIKVETVYESHVIPFFNGHSTVHSTISRPVATLTKTEYEIGTSTLPPIHQQLNPFQTPILQNPFQLTSTPIVTQTQVTATESKILKLTFGAKTAYTTLYSTRVVPTLLTTYLTASIPVQQTAAFPGYFPGPYPPFPYVG